MKEKKLKIASIVAKILSTVFGFALILLTVKLSLWENLGVIGIIENKVVSGLTLLFLNFFIPYLVGIILFANVLHVIQRMFGNTENLSMIIDKSGLNKFVVFNQ